MKSIVHTVGDIHLVDPLNGQEIHWNRPSVVVDTSFVQARMAAGQIKLLKSDLSDDATDEEFAAFLKASENKLDLAIESFTSKFAMKAEEKKEEKKEKKEGK